MSSSAAPSTNKRMNAFEKLMQGASQKASEQRGVSKRGQQQHEQQQQAKRLKLDTSSSAPLPQTSAFSCDQLVCGSQQDLSSSLGSPAAASSHQDAVAAFKRVFSGRMQHRKQKFDYLIVYDLEATCNSGKDLAPVEIIELSCAIVDTQTAEIQGCFQAYVRPTEHPQLDSFCIELTGIQQYQVDTAEPLQAVLQRHHEWLQEQGMFKPGIQFVPVTWTAWDFQIALCTECGWRRIQRPDYLCRWVDLKRYFLERFRRGGNLRTCVEAAGLTWQGRAHSGLDDAMNTARLAVKLMSQGAVFEVTQTSENVPVAQQRSASIEGAGAGSQAANSSPASPSQGRSSMQAIAESKGFVGVFDASGRWTGRCFCNMKAHFRKTKRPGPNHGRQFYACGRWTITQQSEQCAFFMWKEDVPHGSITLS